MCLTLLMPITPIAHNCPSSMATSILLIIVHLPPPSRPPPRLLIKISTVEKDRTYQWLKLKLWNRKGEAVPQWRRRTWSYRAIFKITIFNFQLLILNFRHQFLIFAIYISNFDLKLFNFNLKLFYFQNIKFKILNFLF